MGDFMKKLQIFTRGDSLRDYKIQKANTYGKVYFFEDQVNGIIDVSSGSINSLPIREKIITDGNISLNKLNKYTPQVVWKESLQTLDSGSSIAIEIDGATYMVCIISYGDKTVYEIHTNNPSRELYDKVLAYLFEHRHNLAPNAVFFNESNDVILDNNKQKVLLNLKKSTQRVIR